MTCHVLVGIVNIIKATTEIGASSASSVVENWKNNYSQILASQDVRKKEHGDPFVRLSEVEFRGNWIGKPSPLIFITQLGEIEVCCKPNVCVEKENLLRNPCQDLDGQGSLNNQERFVGTSAQRINYTYEGKTYGKVTSGELMKPINVTLVDVFGKQVPQRGTLTVVKLTNPEDLKLSGVPVEGMFIDGTAHVEGLIMTAKPNVYDMAIEVKFTEEGYQKLQRNISVVVRRCNIGEASKYNGTLCEKCKPTTFNFNISAEDCQKCPSSGAACPGTTVTPLHGYWHSGSLSPVFRTCLIDKACSYKGRTMHLQEEAKKAGEESLLWNDTRYKQCSEVGKLSLLHEDLQSLKPSVQRKSAV